MKQLRLMKHPRYVTSDPRIDKFVLAACIEARKYSREYGPPTLSYLTQSRSQLLKNIETKLISQIGSHHFIKTNAYVRIIDAWDIGLCQWHKDRKKEAMVDWLAK